MLPPVCPEENGKQQKQMHFNFQDTKITGTAKAVSVILAGAVAISLNPQIVKQIDV